MDWVLEDSMAAIALITADIYTMMLLMDHQDSHIASA
jgi:hypothetical protein